MRITSTGDFELPPDAPDAEWLRALVTDYNDLKRQVVSATRALTFAENTLYREKEIELVHGTATEVGVPNDMRGMRIKAVCAMQVQGLTLDSAGKPNGSVYALGLSVPLAWYLSSEVNRVIVTAKYDTSPTTGVKARVNLLFVGE